jgi:DNA polymerase-2
MGFDVLGANTDNIFVRKSGLHKPKDFQPLIDEIHHRTGLIIELEGVFDWLAFLPSKLNPMIGVANRYFGKFADGSIKVRGLAQRRADSPVWIAEAEREIMEKFAESTWNLEDRLSEAIEITRRHFAELDNQQIPLVNLVVKKKLTRELHEYTSPAEAAKAAKQLVAAGKEVRVGQRIRFIYTHGEKTSVLAWGLPEEPAYSAVNKQRYKELLLRTVHQIVQTFGISEEELQGLVERNTKQLPLWQEGDKEKPREITPSLADTLFAPYLPK